MPLTPQDVANKQFKKSYRGYSEAEVDDFLDEVEAELARLLTDNNDLRQRAQTLQQQLSAAAAAPRPEPEAGAAVQPAQPAAERPAPEAPEQAALRTLQMAQRTADQAVAEARAEAEKTMADARARAGALERELQQRHQQAVAELERRRTELEGHIEDLRVFEREYRTRLRAYLETQLRELDSTRETEAPPAGGGSPFTQRPQTAAAGPRPGSGPVGAEGGSAFAGSETTNPFAAVYGGAEPARPPREPGYGDGADRPGGQGIEVDDEGPEPSSG